eukprot:TRINITY_DN2048_c0_g1_i1.p1 TRINITY_DN2048_c0_g1~~TRINITY_DN2048_c0_g1_i1.p1  ORF type:complete len:123 (-),score=38.92 TRINITY_DN2048_c0_g1_i1:101-469(-)
MAFRAVFKIYGENSPTLGNFFKGVVNNTADLNALRHHLLTGRTAYFLRKIESSGGAIGKARVELTEFVHRVRTDPGGFTGRDLGVGAVWAVHIYGCFILGEMLGRGSVSGYKEGRLAPHEGI